MAGGTPLTDEDRKPWLMLLAEKLAKEEQLGGAVLACSSLKQSYRDILASKLSGSAEFVYLRGSYETILARMKSRSGHFMNPGLLKSQIDTLEEPSDAIIVDIELPLNEIVENIATTATGACQI
jgi:carbohydrate kinase (thermoresistant glucokinase family)